MIAQLAGAGHVALDRACDPQSVAVQRYVACRLALSGARFYQHAPIQRTRSSSAFPYNRARTASRIPTAKALAAAGRRRFEHRDRSASKAHDALCLERIGKVCDQPTNVAPVFHRTSRADHVARSSSGSRHPETACSRRSENRWVVLQRFGLAMMCTLPSTGTELPLPEHCGHA